MTRCAAAGAASEAVLTGGREIGVTLVDSAVARRRGRVPKARWSSRRWYRSAVFQVTTTWLRSPHTVRGAEEIKIRHGTRCPNARDDSKRRVIVRPGEADRSRAARLGVIEPRLEEVFELVVEQLERAGLRGLPAGVVLCGGTSQLGGIRRLAAEVFHAPVRIGSPTGIYGLTDQISTPAYATSVGLLKWGLEQEFEPPVSGAECRFQNRQRITNWLRNFSLKALLIDSNGVAK